MNTIQQAHILLVDDNTDLLRLLEEQLRGAGYQNIRTVQNCAAAQTAFAAEMPELMILDINLPDGDGFSLFRTLRAKADVPTLFLSARDADADRLFGLGLGADDYLTKPFAIEELFARIRVALKRSEAVRAASGVGGASAGAGVASGTAAGIATMSPATDTAQTAAAPSPAALAVGSVALDPDRREVTVGGSPIALTAREFDVLALLMTHAETVLTRERIAHEALGYEYVGDTNNVDVHIAHLRAKIEDAGGARIIQTVRGVGYVCRA